jgi:hypothetical protein
MREHDMTALTTAELEAARRELAASLALARPCSPVRGPAWLPSTPNWPFGPRPARVTRLPACPASTGRVLGLRKTPGTTSAGASLYPAHPRFLTVTGSWGR